MWLKEFFSDGALMLTTMDGEDFPSPVNADAVKKVLRIIDPLDEKNKIVQAKMGIPANRKKKQKGKVRAKIRDKMKKCTPGKSKI